MPARVQRTRIKGQPGIPPGAVYVGRGPGSKWGNPFPHDGTPAGRAVATLKFRQHLVNRRNPYPGWVDPVGYPTDEEIVRDLRGRDLACWCPIPAEGETDHCHATVLLELGNSQEAGAAKSQ